MRLSVTTRILAPVASSSLVSTVTPSSKSSSTMTPALSVMMGTEWGSQVATRSPLLTLPLSSTVRVVPIWMG